jgi:hypothetical protein
MAFQIVSPQDTRFLHSALHSFQERNHTARTFLALSPAEQSEIVRDAQDLKKRNPDNLSPEGRRNREACEAILRRRSR